MAICGELPHEEELLPLLPLVRNYALHPKKPVSWALAFGIHTILTSIFEVQGDGDVHNVAQVAESSFGLYFKQLATARRQMKGKAQSISWAENMQRMSDWKAVVSPLTPRTSREQMVRGCWNPFCSGTFLLFTTYFSSLRQGTIMIDDMGRLRMVLHLYNALKDVGMIQAKCDGILELLDRAFANSKAMWEGPKPTRGNFVVRFGITSGSSIKVAKKLSRDAQATFSSVNRSSTTRCFSPTDAHQARQSFKEFSSRHESRFLGCDRCIPYQQLRKIESSIRSYCEVQRYNRCHRQRTSTACHEHGCYGSSPEFVHLSIL